MEEVSQAPCTRQWCVDQQILPCCSTPVVKGTEVLDFATFGYPDLESRHSLPPDAIFRNDVMSPSYTVARGGLRRAICTNVVRSHGMLQVPFTQVGITPGLGIDKQLASTPSHRASEASLKGFGQPMYQPIAVCQSGAQ